MKNNNLDKFGLVKVKNPNGQFLKSVFLGLCMLILSFGGFSFATMMPKSHANAADDSNSASWAVSVFKGSTFDKGFYNINDAWDYMTSNYGSAYTLQINTSQELTKGLVWNDTSASGSLKVTTGSNSVVLAKSASFSGGGSMNMAYAMITVTAGTFEMAPESTDLSITLLGNTDANTMFTRYIINLNGAKSAKFKRVFVSGNYDRAVNITSSNTDAIFEDVTFQGNNTASNQISTMYIESKATFTNCKFINNTTYNSVVYINGGTVTMDTCSFVNNTSSNYGGAITLYSGTLTVSNSEFANNSTSSTTGSPYGGAIYVRNGTLNLSSTNFLYNAASSGGAIYQYGGTISPIIDCTFEGNSASGYGGAISYNTTQSTVRKISNCTFTANYAGTRGGAIDDMVTSNTQQLDITSTTFTKNESPNGSAIANMGASLILTSCDVSNNYASGTASNNKIYGSTIFVLTGVNQITTFTNTNFTQNHAREGTTCAAVFYGEVTASGVSTNLDINGGTFTKNTGATLIYQKGGGFTTLGDYDSKNVTKFTWNTTKRGIYRDSYLSSGDSNRYTMYIDALSFTENYFQFNDVGIRAEGCGDVIIRGSSNNYSSSGAKCEILQSKGNTGSVLYIDSNATLTLGDSNARFMSIYGSIKLTQKSGMLKAYKNFTVNFNNTSTKKIPLYVTSTSVYFPSSAWGSGTTRLVSFLGSGSQLANTNIEIVNTPSYAPKFIYVNGTGYTYNTVDGTYATSSEGDCIAKVVYGASQNYVKRPRTESDFMSNLNTALNNGDTTDVYLYVFSDINITSQITVPREKALHIYAVKDVTLTKGFATTNSLIALNDNAGLTIQTSGAGSLEIDGYQTSYSSSSYVNGHLIWGSTGTTIYMYEGVMLYGNYCTDGGAGSAIYLMSGSVTFRGGKILDCFQKNSNSYGRVIYIGGSTGSFSMYNCTYESFSAMEISAATVTISNSMIHGAGNIVDTGGNTYSLKISDSYFVENNSTGGSSSDAIKLDRSSNYTISNCQFVSKGITATTRVSSLTLTNCYFAKTSALNINTKFTMQNSKFMFGGKVSMTPTSYSGTTITNNEFVRCTPTSGGVLTISGENTSEALTLTNNTFMGCNSPSLIYLSDVSHSTDMTASGNKYNGNTFTNSLIELSDGTQKFTGDEFKYNKASGTSADGIIGFSGGVNETEATFSGCKFEGNRGLIFSEYSDKPLTLTSNNNTVYYYNNGSIFKNSDSSSDLTTELYFGASTEIIWNYSTSPLISLVKSERLDIYGDDVHEPVSTSVSHNVVDSTDASASIVSATGSGNYINLEGVAFEGNSARALYIKGSNPTVCTTGSYGVYFTANYSLFDGGACYIMNTGNTSTTYQWYDVDFTANLARGNGGAIYFDDTNGTVNVTTKSWSSCYFGNNASSANGGAIYINSASAVYIDTTTFSMNYATNGGAVYTSAGIVLQTNLEMSHNYASANGGAIYGHYFNKIITVNTKDASLNYNRATNGGAIYLENQVNGNFQTTTFGYNQVTGNGGAIYKADTSSTGVSTTLEVTSGTYTHNQATGNGGAVYVSQVGYTGESNKYLNNSANLGGAIYDYATTMDNNISVNIKRWLVSKYETFTSNTAVQGGAIYSQNSIKCGVYGATFDGNSASGNSDDGIKSLGGSIYIDGALEINTGYNATFGAKISNSKADRGSAIYYYNLSSSNYSFNISGLTLSGCGDSYSAIVNAGGNLNLGGEINIPDKKHIIEIAPTDISAQIVLLGKLTNSYNIPYPIIANSTYDEGGFFDNYVFVQANGSGETALINEGTYSGTNAGNQFEYQDNRWSLKRGTASDKTSMIYITYEEKAGYLHTDWQLAIGATLANITSIEFTNVDPSATYSYVGSVGATGIDGGTKYSSVYTSTYTGNIRDVVAYTDTTKTLLKIYCPEIIYFPTSCSKLFQQLTALKEITFNNVDTSYVVSVYSMFDGCTSLTTINTKILDLSSVTDAGYMFAECTALSSFDASKFAFSSTNGIIIRFMFDGCTSLTNIDLSSWTLVGSGASTYQGLFRNCSKLVSVKLGNMTYQSKVTIAGLTAMFKGCSALTSIDFGKFNVAHASNVRLAVAQMFNDCSSIKNIDLTSLSANGAYITTLSNTFNGCTSLETLNLGSLGVNSSSLTTTNAFTGCTSLKTIVLPYVTDGTEGTWSITLPTSGKFYYTDTKAIVGTDGTTIGLPASNFSTKSQARTIKVGYTVTANANSGSISATPGWTGTGSTATTFAFWDEKITFPTVTRTAYSLKKGSNNTGWYTAASAGTELASPFTPTADQTIYAQWTATPYTIKINNNGGSNGSVNNASYTIGTSAQTRTLTNPTRAGYNFASWKVSWTDSTHSATLPTVSGTTLTIPANCYGNVTLTANWTPINYTLTYNANGGNAVSSKTYTIETNTFALASTSRTGYTFAGWKVTAISGTAYSASGTKIAVGNTITQIFKGSYANITIQAQWTANKQTITFYATSDTASSTPSVDYDATYSMPANPTKSGFTFVGWSEGKDATAEWTSGTQTCKGPKSWYAVWKRSATINYFYINASGARATGATETLSTNVIYSSTDKSITFTIKAVGNKSFKANNDTYTFTGFSTDGTSNATGTYAIASDVASKTTTYKTTADTTNMYAVYTSTITLAYNANTGSGAPASQKGVVTKSAGTSAIQTKAVSLTISSTTPTKSGFAFQGWNTSSTATSASHTAGTAYSFDKSTTLYAVWKDATKPVVGTYAWTQNSARNGFDIYANASDNVGVTKVSIPVWTAKNNSTRSDIKWANATKGSYTFNGASYEYKLSVLISDFSNHYGTYQFQVFAYDAANNLTTGSDQNFMNFTWNITYDYASGTKGATNPATYLSKETAQSITLSNPTRTGYTFAGWTSSVSGITVASEKIAIPAETHADVKLTATWSASALTFNNQELNAGTYGTAYTSNAFTGATGGTGSYLYTIKSGAPTDAKIDSAKRTISFTSTTNAGTYSVVVTAKDNGSGVTKDATMTIVINRLKTATASAKTGLVYNGSSQTGVTGSNVSWSGTTSATNAGSYKATATPNANYAWSDGTYTAKEISWTIDRASVSVPASPSAKTYNGASQASGITTPSGASVVSASSTTSAINAGTYTVTFQVDGNHKWSDGSTGTKAVTWKINPKSLAISWSNASLTYTGSAQHPTASVATGVSGETISFIYAISAKSGSSLTNGSAINAGSYTATATAKVTGGQAKLANYTLSPLSKDFTISKANLTVTADNKTMTFGGTAPTYSVSYSGFVNGETSSVLNGTLAYTTKNSAGTTVTVNASLAVGTYTITPSGLTSANYNITFKNGTLTVQNKSIAGTISITGNVQYGSTLTSTITGGVSGATYSYQWQISADGTTWTNCSREHGTASTFMITATRTGVDLVVGKYLRVVYTATGNYTGTITSDKTTAVTKCGTSVTVTPSATVTKVYDGTTSVKQTFTLTPANVLGNDGNYITLTAGTATYDNANVGTGKTVTVAFTSSGTRAGNYSFAGAKTTGAITPATMTYKVNNYSGTYDGNAHGITVSVTTPSGATVKYGLVEGTYDKTASPTRTEAGTTTVYVQITAANYTTVTTTGTITINKATLSTPTASWSTTARGTATWTASTAIKGITISYKVELYKSGSTTAIATQTVSGTSYNFASAIRQSGAGTYTFKVTAISSATANANHSATATSGNLYAVSVSVTAGTGIASATISGASSYVMINGESATVAYTTKTGYSLASITSGDTARLTMSNTTTATLKDSITTTGAITITVTGYANGYTVTFNGNNGTLTNQTSLNLTYNGSSYNAIAGHVSATRTGYTLTGWFDKATGGNMIWNASGNAVKGTYWTDTVANGGKWQYAGNVTAYAQWTANPYGLTVKAMSNTAKDQSTFANNTVGGTVKIASGTAGATATGNVNFDSTTTITATAAAGYKFAGWYTTTDFSGTAVSTSATFTTAKMTTAGQTYYAKFVADTVTITVSVTNPSHGSIGLDTDNTTNDYGITTNSSTKTTYTFKKTSKVTFKLDLKTGYQVVSFTDNSTSAQFTSGAYVLNNLSGNHELVLTTKPISYTVTVYYNGENGLTKLTKSYDYGSTVSVTPTALKGYSTSGWTTTPYTAISQTSRVDIASTNLSVKVTGDATYYQVFNTALSICYYSNWNNSLYGDTTTATTKNIYTSISEDGSAIITGSITMTTNYEVTSTPDGYTFVGWTAYNNGFENNSKTLEVTVGNKQGTYSWIGSYGFFYNVHAVWERTITQTITYNANGHGTAPSNQSASATQFANYALTTKTTPQVTITLASAISATGYIFASWNTSADGKGTDYSAGAKFTANLSESTTTTLYAKWTTDAYTISYDLAGGVLPSGKTNPTSYSVDTASFTLNNPERTGYTFTGWTGSNGTTPQTTVTITKGTTGNKSYTANWLANTYKVVFNANGGFVNDANYWYQYSYQTKFVSTFDSATQLSTIDVVTAPGYWEIIGTPIAVTANTDYTITFDYEMPAFNYLSGYDGLRVQILTQTPSNSNFANATHVSLKSQGKGTSSITFNSGSNTTVYFVINCGFMEDGHTYSFKIGNLKCAQSTQQLSTKSVTYDATYGTLPTPTRAGYTFQGWFTDKTAGTRVTKTSKVSITANQTLYAHWSVNGYKINYIHNNKTGTIDTVDIDYDATYPTITVPTRTGYNFAGYYLAKDYTSSYGVSYHSDTKVIRVSFNGNWSSSQFKVGDKLYFKLTLKNVSNITGIEVNDVAISNINYAFVGNTLVGSFTIPSDYSGLNSWNFIDINFSAFDNAELTSVDMLAIQSADASLVYDMSGKAQFTTYQTAGNSTLLANWDSKWFKIEFDANGGTLTSTTTAVAVNYDSAAYSNIKSIITVERTGYTFLGWYDSATGGNSIWDSNGNAINGTYWTNYKWSYDGAVTAYARWSANGYTVKFDANEGTLSGKTEIYVAYDGTSYNSVKTHVSANRTGYTFLGWFDSATGGNMIWDASGDGVKGTYWTDIPSKNGKWCYAGNVTAYAHWQAKVYTVTIMPNGGTITVNDQYIKKNADGSVSFTKTYNTTAMNYLSVSGSKDGYTTLGIFDKASGGVKVWGNGGACLNDGTYWKDNTWIYAGDVTLYFQYKDATKPVVERTTYVINSARNGYDVYAYVTDNEAINRVQFPTWTEKDGQDDLLEPWMTRSEYTGTSGSWTVNGKVYNYKFTALVSAHNNEYGTYNTYINAYDNAGNESATSAVTVNFTWNISYDLAGGTKGATNPATYLSKETAQTITLSNPTRTGYTFAGWTSSVSAITVASEKITIPAETHADVTLTATWKANATNIKYDSNGGTINLFNGNLVDGTFSSYDSKTNTITFNGENKKGQMPQFSYIDLSTTGLMVEGAKFTMTSWGISGSITSSAVQNILYEIASGKGNTLATRNSVPHSITEMLKYVYNPYVNSTTLTATNITDGAIGIYTWIFGGQDETYTNAKFYFQITLVGAESTITIPTAYDANLAYYMPTAVRGGYTFDGWYTAKTGGTKVNPADANSFADGVTLYAHWTASSYDIAVDSVGGSTVTVNNSKYTTSTASQTRTISTAIPTKANYEFNSWQVEWTDGAHSSTLPTVSGQTITIPADCYGSFKLVAKWDEAVASVTFDGTTTYHSTLNKAFTKANGQVSTASKNSTITILVKTASITSQINVNGERFVNLTASVSTTITRTGKFAMISNYGTFKIYGTDSVSITFQGDTQDAVLLGNNAKANLTLGKNVIITGNTTTSNGCAVTSVGTLTVDGASITNNKGGNGAGIMSFKNSSGTGILNIISGSFTGNSATNGGAIYSQGEMTISGGTFDSNTASASGGAIQNSGKLVITGGTFINNTADYGGVIGNKTGATIEISGGSFTGNNATNIGGVIQNDGTSVTITGGTFDSNSATNNAGVLNNANSKGIVTISNASFTNNKATYGGALYNIGTLTINSGTFTGNSVTKQGGVMRHTGGTLTINGGTFESNSSTGAGAVISMGNTPITYIKGGAFNANTSGSYAGVADCYGSVEVTGGTFTNNSAVNGGGVFSQGAAAGHILTITAGRFESNKVTSGQGGAVLIHQGTIGGTAEFISNTAKSGAGAIMAGQLSVSITGGTFSKNSSNNGGAIKAQTKITISGGTFTENTATTQNGGAIYFNQATVITITGGTFTGNKADNGQGGAIYSESKNTATITAVFKQNSAKYGGAISNAGSDLTLSGCEITSNTASNNGGAVYSSGTLVVSGGSFTSNTSSASGGAIASTVEATITNVTFDSNSAVSGGALYLNGTATLSGNTFKNNSSTGNGGAIYSIGTTSITGDTFLDNSVASGKDGSGVFVVNGTTTITSATMTTTYASASNIRVEGNGTAIIGGTKSGEVVTIGSKTNRNNYGIRSYGKLTINNAEIYSMRESVMNHGTTVVNDGIYDSYINGTSSINFGVYSGTTTVNGGTFKNGELSDEKRYGNAFYVNNGTFNIYGGTFESGWYAYTSGTSGVTNIYGGDFSKLILGLGTGGTINVNADVQISTFNWQGNGGTLNINSDFTLLDCIVFGADGTKATLEDQIINVTTELKNSYNMAIYTSSVADYNAKYINTTTPVVTYASGVTPNANNFAITSTSAVDGGTAKAVKIMTGSTLKANLGIEDYDVQGLYLVGKVTVSFDAVGGTASKSSMEVYYGNAYGELATATKPNYDFAGWYLESTYATGVTSTSIVKSSTDHTLYAKWESAVASVTFGTEVTYYSTLEKAFAYANSLATTSSKNATVTILVDSITVSSKIVVSTGKFINLTSSVSTTIARQGNPLVLHNYATLNIYGTDSISITFQGDENNETLIFNETEGSLTLGKNVILTGNKTSVFGGAIYNKGTLTINGASITNNTADCGGAICNVGTITINSGTISGNSSTSHGGAIIIVAGTITIVDGTFSGNSGNNGGFLASSNSPKIFVKGGTFENNTASAYGGVLDISGTAEITGGLFKNNKAYGGGAMSQVEATSSVVTVTGGTFDSNTATVRSGAINIHNGSIGGSAVFTNNIVTDGHAGAVGIGKNNVTITGGTFTGNKAENGQGGAIYNESTNPATISGAVFKQNTAKNGGAIFNSSSTITITDCEFTGNTSTENGGAILTKQNLTISGTTFSGNSATGTIGSAIKVESGTTTITSATITNSTVGSAIHVDADATVIIGGTGTNDKVVIGSASNRVFSGITSYGQLTINNAEVYTSQDVLKIYGGKTTINNGTFNSYTNNVSTSVISTLNATVVINNGTFGIGSSSDANRKGRAFIFKDSTVVDIYGGSFETCYDAFVENSSVLNIHAGTLVGNLAINNATINILGNATLSKILFGDRAGIINIGSDFTLTTHIQIGPGSTTANEQIINVNKTLTKTYTLVIYTSSTADYNAKYINTTNAVVTYASGVTPNASNFAITSTSAISGGTAKAVKLMTGSVLRTNLGNNDYSTQGLYLVGKVTVSFNAVGGTASKASMEVYYGNAYGTLATATKSGFDFAGWYLENTYATVVNSTSIVKSSTDHTLYAKWEEKFGITVNVNFDSGCDTNTKVVVRIYDLTNKTVRSFIFYNDGSTHKLDLVGFSAGSYMISITTMSRHKAYIGSEREVGHQLAELNGSNTSIVWNVNIEKTTTGGFVGSN